MVKYNFFIGRNDLIETYQAAHNRWGNPTRLFPNKSAEHVLDHCLGMYATTKDYTIEEEEQFCEEASISPKTVQIMHSIAKDYERLRILQKYLPPCLTAIWEINRMDDNQIQVGITKGVIHSAATTIGLRRFQGKFVNGLDVKPFKPKESWNIIKVA